MYKRIVPLARKEVTDFQIDKAVQNGMIPRHYMIDDATRLEGYVEVYLREEIRDRNPPSLRLWFSNPYISTSMPISVKASVICSRTISSSCSME